MNTNENSSFLEVLGHAGSMGQLIAEKDWSAHPLGRIDAWPASLKTVLSAMLYSRFPKFLFWGPELYCFYNDAYRPSLGINGKHPSLLGAKAVEGWKEIWDFINANTSSILQGGSTIWFEDQLVPIERNGKTEDVYWTYSYSPVFNEKNERAGVLVTTFESTAKVLSYAALEASNKRFSDMLMQAPVGMCLLTGETFSLQMANEAFLAFIGRSREQAQGKDILEVVPEAKPLAEVLLKQVFSSGEPYYGKEMAFPILRNEKIENVFFNFSCTPVKKDGAVESIIIVAVEVTDLVSTKLQFRDGEERLRLATEGTQTATWDYSIASGELLHSDYMAEIFDFPAGTKLERSVLLEYIIPEDRDKTVVESLDKAMQTGDYQYDARIRTRTGNLKWIRVKGRVLLTDDNKAQRVLGIMQDITREKKHEYLLEESERKYRFLADSIPQLVWTADQYGVINYWNKTVFTETGYTPEEITRETGWETIVHPDDRDEYVRRWQQAMATGTDFIFEHRIQNINGQYKWQLSRAVPQINSRGETEMWVGTSTDIDEIKKHEALKDDFIKMANHELKTPLTIIKGYVQLLMKTKNDAAADPALASSLQVINNQVDKLNDIIETLLDISKVDAGEIVLKKQNTAIAPIIEEAIRDTEGAFPSHKIIFQNSAPADARVYGDKNRLLQVLLNIFSNAVKYSPKREKIYCSLTSPENELIVEIRDEGIGIDEIYQPFLFDKFYRVPGKKEATFPGFGVGLFIVDEIIRKHAGRVWVTSCKGQGASFFVSLPLLIQE